MFLTSIIKCLHISNSNIEEHPPIKTNNIIIISTVKHKLSTLSRNLCYIKIKLYSKRDARLKLNDGIFCSRENMFKV